MCIAPATTTPFPGFDRIRKATQTVSNSRLDPVHILAALRVTAARATAQAARPDIAEPEIILLSVPSAKDLDLYEKAAQIVFDIPTDAADSTSSKAGFAIYVDHDFGKSALSAALQTLYALIGSGQSVVMITNAASRIPRDIMELVDLTLRPAPVTADLICATLSLSHSDVATEAVRELLPPNDRLTHLSPVILKRAFSGKTTLDVARALKASESKVTQDAGSNLDQVFGQPKLQEAFRSMIADLQKWSEGTLNWKDVTASFLLYGPPGTGKTHSAEALATTAGLPLVSGSYAEWQKEGHQGQMLAAMYAAANQAIATAPCVFFLDEIDSFDARTQGGANSQYMRGVVNGLLTVMTLLNETEGVIVVAATNFPEFVDPAILRAGRLDMHIPITFLDRNGVHDMLNHRCGDLAENPETWSEVINSMIGMTGADIDCVIRKAKTAARREGEALSPAHLLRACQQTGTIDRDLLWRVAVHEAGHVISHIDCSGKIPEKVIITTHGGEVICPKSKTVLEQEVMAELTVWLSGRAAELHVLGSVSAGSGTGVDSDLAMATQLAAQALLQYGFFGSALTWETLPIPFRMSQLQVSDAQKVSGLLDDAAQRAATVCRRREGEIVSLAEALLEKREMSKAEITETLGAEHLSPEF